MFVDFNNYLNTIKNNDIYDYFNCYSTALITRKDLKDNILTHRMNFLINYYVSNLNNNINKSELINYYLKNYKDVLIHLYHIKIKYSLNKKKMMMILIQM